MEQSEVTDELAKLFASTPKPWEGINLSLLQEKMNSFRGNLCDTYPKIDDGNGTNSSGAFKKISSRLEMLVNGTTHVPDSDLPFVVPHCCVNAIRLISRENEQHEIFLKEESRELMNRVVEIMIVLKRQNKIDFTELVKCLNNRDCRPEDCVDLPLEILWRLHSSGILLITTYINEQLECANKLVDLKKDLLTLICCFESDSGEMQSSQVSGGSQTSQIPLQKQMVADFLGSMLVASQRTHLRFYKACSILLEAIVKKALNKLVLEDSDPPGNYLHVLRHDPLVSENDLRAFASDILHSFLTMTPNVTLKRAISTQSEWLFDKTPAQITAFLHDVLLCVGIPNVIKIIMENLQQADVNWKYLMIVISTFVTCIQGASKHVKTLISTLVEESITAMNREALTLAFLVVRQCCSETGSLFPAYPAWFGMTFSASLSTLAFKFLLEFLEDLVPVDPPYCLRAHICKLPTAPSGLHYLITHYTAIARSRLQELNEDSASSLLGNTSIEEDVKQVAEHFQKTGNIFPSLMTATLLHRQQFEKVFVPKLVAGGHDKIVAKLLNTGRISKQLLDKISKQKIGPGKTTVDSKVDEILLLLTKTAQEFQITCDLPVNLDQALSTLLAKLPMTNENQMQLIKKFGNEYFHIVDSHSELTLNHCLLKKLRFACERLDVSGRVSCQKEFKDTTVNLTEWLDYEYAVKEEFLHTSSRRSYLRIMKARFLTNPADYRDMLKLLIAILLEHTDNNVFNSLVSDFIVVILPTKPGDETSDKEPILLDLWSNLPVSQSHEAFFSVVKMLPEWLLLTNSLSTKPTQKTIMMLSSLINDNLDSLSHESLLWPEFVTHLLVGFDLLCDPLTATVVGNLLNTLVDSATPLYVALVVYLKPLPYPLECLCMQVDYCTPAGRIQGLLQDLSSLPLSQARKNIPNFVEKSLKYVKSWEVAMVIWLYFIKSNDSQYIEDVGNELFLYPELSRCLFFFLVLELGLSLNKKTAAFSITTNRLWFTTENISDKSPLQVLDSFLDRDDTIVDVLDSNQSTLPLDMFSPKTFQLTASAGLLYLVERRNSRIAAMPSVLRILPLLGEKFFSSLQQGLVPEFLSTNGKNDLESMRKRREFLDTVKILCHEMIGKKQTVNLGITEPDSFHVDDEFFDMVDDFS